MSEEKREEEREEKEKGIDHENILKLCHSDGKQGKIENISKKLI